ncbi:hypothetical protein [Corallococcus caeni]|uniref:Glutathione S-transferase family protein n=1 Tax=Corallococcus caeni TaxID=3082388 RepID=A0ABQ6QR94_9BACT|nr:hypothetical protein ASNO1_27970 [Corallococcus sp. NO1]
MALPILFYGVPSGCSFGSIVALEWLGRPYHARGVGTGLSFAQGTGDFDRLNQMLAYLNTTFFSAFSPLWYGIARWTRYHEVLDRHDYPKVQGLFERLEADAGVRFAHAIEKGETPQGSGAFQGYVRLAEALHRRPPAP